MPTEIDVVERRIRQLEIERVALAKETDAASQERLDVARRGAGQPAGAVGEHEGALAGREGRHRRTSASSRSSSRRSAAELERETDLEKAAEIRYGQIPELERRDRRGHRRTSTSCRARSRC